MGGIINIGLTGPFSRPLPVARARKLPPDGTDPEARPSAFWRKVRDSGAGKMELGLLLKWGSGVAPPHPARPAALPGPFPERRDSEAPSQWDGPGSSSNRLLAEGKRLRSREMEMELGSL